jgi:hypothetical protein
VFACECACVHLQNTFFIKICVHICVHAHMQVYAHHARLQPTAQINCPHYIHQYIDRCTYVSQIKFTCCKAYQFKSQPSTNGKRNLIYCIHIPLVEELHANRGRRGEQRQKSLVLFSLGQNQGQFYCSSLVPDLWDMATIWMMGVGGRKHKKTSFFEQNNSSLHHHTFLYTKTTNH